MIYYLGNIEPDIVDAKVKKARNKVANWKYGYDKEYDIVIISKNGTLGPIYNINGLKIGLPAVPKHENIINYNITPTNQKWMRDESMPYELTAESIDIDVSKLSNGPTKEAKIKALLEKLYLDNIDYINSEFDKREEGVWVYLKGEPVYLTGVYWFFLQWIRIEEDYPALRLIQNELMIYWEACKADYRCYGMQYVKNRRMGASSLGVAELLESSTIYESKILGIISKTGEDAGDIFQRVVTAFKRLPFFFQPVHDGNTAPKKELLFQEASRKKKKGEANSQSSGLGTSLKWYFTAINAMDGRRVFRSLLDEGGKWDKVDFEKYWNIVKTSHRKGRIIFGKCFMVSTLNDPEEGGQQYKNIWDKSDPTERDGNGQTGSGLYRLFIPAKFCLEGFFDVYGFSITDDPDENGIESDDGTYVYKGAITHLQNELDGKKDNPDDYNEQIRQFPDKVEDAFRGKSENCAFNLLNILNQEEYNARELEETKYGNNEVERGNFSWENGIQDTNVQWNPDPNNGRFWIAKNSHPNKDYRNKKEKRRINGVLAWAPMNEHIGCFGVDPYNTSVSADGKGSKGAIHLSTKFNTGPFPNNAFILEYIDKAPKIELFFEDVLMAMVYFGMPMLSELSNYEFLRMIKNRGYRHFSMNNPYKPYHELNPAEKELGGVPPQNQKIGDQQYYAMQTYINDYVGVAIDESNRPIGKMGYFPFSRTLAQLRTVDVNKRTKYDAYISSSLSLIGNQKPISQKIEKSKPVNVMQMFKQYDNSGNVSKAI